MSRNSKMSFAVLLIFVLAACRQGTTGPSDDTDPINGTWAGTLGSDGIREVLVLTQSGGAFTGTSFFENQQGGALSGGRGVVSGSVSGTDVRFTLSRDGLDFRWVGSVNESYTTLNGTFQGYSNLAVYTKQN